MSVEERIARLRPTAVNSILAEVRALQSEGHDLVSLMRGEPDMRTPKLIVDACVKSLRDGRTGYPDNRGEMRLREAAAEKMRRDNGIVYDPATEILVTTGATFGIYAALSVLAGEGDEVLAPEPIYDAYHSPIALTGARCRSVAAELRGTRFKLTTDLLERAITPACKALLLNSPWNPTGVVFCRDELAALCEWAMRHGLWIISDEIYEAITYGDAVHVSPASLSPETRERCIVVNSLSKTYAMTGWRVGYCAAPREIINAMFLVLQQSSRGPATFVQDAAAVALSEAQDCVAEMQLEYARRRDDVVQTLSSLKTARVMPPEGGFFAMVNVRDTGRDSQQVRQHLLHKHGVVVVHGSAYGAAGEGTLRVSFASGGETLRRGLTRLREGLADL